MAYNAAVAQPRVIARGIAGAPNVWVYKSADAHTDVDATGYFANGEELGMKVNDIVYVQTNTTLATTLHSVSAVSGAGAATISAAVLA